MPSASVAQVDSVHEGDLEASLLYVVGRVNQGIRREMRARLTAWKLSVQQYTALSVLQARPGLSNAQLARRALVTPQSMLEILSKLEERGLVRRVVDPGHALILRAELTQHGWDLLAEADPVIRAIQEELPRNVAPAERRTAMRVMRQAMDRLAAVRD